MMTSSPKALIRPRAVSRRGWFVIGLVIIAVVSVLTVISRLYDAEGGIRVLSGLGPSANSGLILSVDPLSVEPTKNRATLHVQVAATGSDLIDDSGRLKENTRLLIDTEEGEVEVKFPAGTPPTQFEMIVGLDGEEAWYPFDQHQGQFVVTGDTYTKGADGIVQSVAPVSVGLQGVGGVNGWDTTFDFSQSFSPSALGSVSFQRAFSTQAFAILILLLATVLTTLALAVGVLIFTRRRRIEAALLAWTASLLFALPLLRNYMPNSPPVGAALDIYIYLWLIAMAVTAAVLVILGWMGQNRDLLLARRDESDGRHAP